MEEVSGSFTWVNKEIPHFKIPTAVLYSKCDWSKSLCVALAKVKVLNAEQIPLWVLHYYIHYKLHYKALISIVMLYLLKLEILWAIRYICDKLIWPDNISQPICRATCRQHIFLIKPIIPGFSASDLKLKHSNLRWVMNATETAQVLSDTCLWFSLYPWKNPTLHVSSVTFH